MDNPVLTKKLSRLGRLGCSVLKRFMYSQMMVYAGFRIAIGKDQPLVQFKVEMDPPSVYWVYRIKSSEIDRLIQTLRIPPNLSLTPVRCGRNGPMVSCTSCHTANPKQAGRTRVNKLIEPIAPVANPQRFTDAAKVEKWFRRNCMDVLQRECSAQEKGDFIAWLNQIK